ncbi:hypothetical protein MVES1_000885 [Malassezia vespertilionis]|uniref:Uncharacterized protein n=1 Tax=Malassezia vespertilionis TaxID=2020962 RepID=A0A2N1JEL4_9BASI|nr:uncharacterized protein MVES1_000885 [Malassezia vespertilionis]PKI84992.1 hypothetical protein MVES_000833 [Malassezia vespertilionis]WFD05555.1 hypothetical protein MVES1_000885 [Malassezia vespertilionis]
MDIPNAVGGQRVLIAAFALPLTLDFLEEHSSPGELVKDPISVLSSPVPKHANTGHMAHVLASRLQREVEQDAQSGTSAPTVKSPHLSTGTSSRKQSTNQREHVSMAELMAEASGSGTAYLQPHESAVMSGPPSPQSHRASAGSLSMANAEPELAAMYSDHGRSASGEFAPPRIPRSRPENPSSAPGAQSRQGAQGAHPKRDTNVTPPVSSIISDMAAKSNLASQIGTPKEPQNPFVMEGTAHKKVPSTSWPHSAPLLKGSPNVLEGWSDLMRQDDATILSPELPQTHDDAAPFAYAVKKAVKQLQVLPSGRVTVSEEERQRTEAQYREEAALDKSSSGTVPRRPRIRHRTSLRHTRRSRSTSVSYRTPIESVEEGLMQFKFLPNPGANYGLINAVNSVGRDRFPNGKLFIGTLGIEMDSVPDRVREDINDRALREHDCAPVWVSDHDHVHSYHHYCKQILWPTFHYTLPTGKGLESEEDAFRSYVAVNQHFADRIVELYQDGDVVWVQDYHLLLVPGMVRERLPRATIGLFVHIAFPSSELFRCLGMRKVLLQGMLGSDLVSFQTHTYCRHFRQTVSRILHLEGGTRGIQLDYSFVTVAPFPIGIDVHALNRKRENPTVKEWIERLEERYMGKYLIVGRDKLDWIKGVREKLLGFEVFLDEYPEWVGKVVLVQVALATAQESKEVGDATDIVARINRKHSTLTYQPVVFLHVQEITFGQYLALLSRGDVFLATSLREGMNLTSHEYIIAQDVRKRPLVLSEFTGTYATLRACIGINPFNTRQVASAIQRALVMSEEEMRERWTDLHHTVVTQTAQHWITSVLSHLKRARQRQPNLENLFIPRLDISQLVSELRAAQSRLILLDLEDCLAVEDAIALHKQGFQPLDRMLHMLARLASDARNYVYVFSGKCRQDLDRIAQHVPDIGLIAEHGCYLRQYSVSGATTWTSLIDGFSLEWQAPVLDILHDFAKRTPGSWIVEREASVSLHYSQEQETTTDAEREWTARQAAEVQSLIYDSLGERYSLRILRGDASFTVMPKTVSRTTAVQYLLTLDAMGALPSRTLRDERKADVACATQKGIFSLVLQIGTDENMIAFLNQLDVTFAPYTCTTREMSQKPLSGAAYQLRPGAEVDNALEEIIDLRERDSRWGERSVWDV